MSRKSSKFLSLLCAVAVATTLLCDVEPAVAQESSVTVLEAPTGPSSGETMPEEQSGQAAAPAGEVSAEGTTVETTPAPPPPCGTQPITMARMQWPTAALLTEIHAKILQLAFNCVVEIQEGDLATVGSSMGANGQPAAAPEMWISRIAEIWNSAIKAQEVRQAGTSYADQVFEGWFVPDYAVTTWPDITTIEGLKAHAAEMVPGRKPKFISCPIDWACNIINRNMLRANGLDQLFEVVEPANRFELDTLIAEAVGKKEPILFYYWQPNAILSQFAFREVALGPFNKDNFLCLGRVACATPLPTGFAPDPVIIALSEWVYTDAPQIASYFQRAKMPFAEMNAMLQQLSETGATVESVAARFIAERQAVWHPWVNLPVEPGQQQPAGEVAPQQGQDQQPVIEEQGRPSVEFREEDEEDVPRRRQPEDDDFEDDNPNDVRSPSFEPPQSLT
jgi:glycine betaine/proline transport system substrate-binding protein